MVRTVVWRLLGADLDRLRVQFLRFRFLCQLVADRAVLVIDEIVCVMNIDAMALVADRGFHHLGGQNTSEEPYSVKTQQPLFKGL